MLTTRLSRALARASLLYRPSSQVAVWMAMQAVDRGAVDEALSIADTIIKYRPDWTIGYAVKAGALKRARRIGEADEVLREALRRFPRDALLLTEHAWVLHEAGEVEAALEHWRVVRELLPDRPDGIVGEAAALRLLMRLDEAEALLAEAIRRFPRFGTVFSNHAVIADLRGDREEALRRWQVVRAQFPEEPVGFAGVGAALKMLGRYDEADQVLVEGMKQFPNDANIAINHAWVAVTKTDWPEAQRRWLALRERWPGHETIRNGLSETAMQISLSAAEDGRAPEVSPGAGLAAEEIREVALQFESLGENCELGFVQRHFEAEPLGLFRWAGISVERLVVAAESDFAGIGEAEFTDMKLNESNREYYTEDTRYGMSMHTFVLEGTTPREALFGKMCRRLAYLRGKLIDDMAEAEKVFVVNTPSPLDDATLRNLAAVLRRHGPISLLHTAPHHGLPVGTVVEVGPRLWRGSLERTGFNGRVWNIEFNGWATIMRNCLALHTAAMARERV